MLKLSMKRDTNFNYFVSFKHSDMLYIERISRNRYIFKVGLKSKIIATELMTYGDINGVKVDMAIKPASSNASVSGRTDATGSPVGSIPSPDGSLESLSDRNRYKNRSLLSKLLIKRTFHSLGNRTTHTQII